MTPFIIVGGILLGWFTATESAAAAAVCDRPLGLLLPRDGREEAVGLPARNRQAIGDRAVLRRYRLGVRVAARLFPDSAGNARERDVVGTRPHRRGFFIAFVFLSSAAFSTRSPPSSSSARRRSRWPPVNMHPVSFAIIGIVALPSAW